MKAQAEATDTKDQVILLQSQLKTLNREIGALKNSVLSGGKDAETDLHPKKNPKADELFDVVVANCAKHSTESTSNLNSTSEQSGTNAAFILRSYGSSSTNASSDSSNALETKDYDFDIGFRATKVTIDRGVWFNPEVLENSNSMLSTSPRNAQGDRTKFTDNFQPFQWHL